ncbi:MAG: hypothetical protein IPI83_10970 [Sphingomonadales bacterium]|nr:hypothetical protein [Sphingomonadales bacterium]
MMPRTNARITGDVATKRRRGRVWPAVALTISVAGSLAGMGQTHQLLYRAMRIAMFAARQIRDDFSIGLTAGGCAFFPSWQLLPVFGNIFRFSAANVPCGVAAVVP